MKFKKKTAVRSDISKIKDDKVVISSEYYENDRPSYICSFCNQTLIWLTDAGMNNTSFWCRHCSIEFDPESENLRKESKLIVPDRNIEPAVSTTPGIPDVSIHHTVPTRGGFKELEKKGLKIKDYHTSERE